MFSKSSCVGEVNTSYAEQMRFSAQNRVTSAVTSLASHCVHEPPSAHHRGSRAALSSRRSIHSEKDSRSSRNIPNNDHL